MCIGGNRGGGERNPQKKFTKSFLVVWDRSPLLKFILKILAPLKFEWISVLVGVILKYIIYCCIICVLHRTYYAYIDTSIDCKKKAPFYTTPNTGARVLSSSQTDDIASRSFCTYVTTHSNRTVHRRIGRNV